MLKAISPIDGRYQNKTEALSEYYSEFALIKYRVYVEIEYFIALSQTGITPINISDIQIDKLRLIYEDFSEQDAQTIKETEAITNHDVKAVEYFVKSKLESLDMGAYLEFVHFALTSQDINNTVLPLQIQNANKSVMLPAISNLIEKLNVLADSWMTIPMLAHTHGQAASPTTVGKEFMVFVERLNDQITALNRIELKAKFGGATGQFNAHVAAYPNYDWIEFANSFCGHLGIKRAQWTTQISHYDDHAEVFQAWSRINTILKDLCIDIWIYISKNYFGQKTIKGEVGSSAMPHKVNPIDFENAEGNLGLSTAIFNHLANKLPVSRMQRDLTDSTVGRNIGVPFSHTLIAIKSIEKGLGKLLLNEHVLENDLNNNWAVVAEAIQNILRKEGYPKPYEALKDLTRGQKNITQDTLVDFIDQLTVSDELKTQMKAITPFNYLGTLNR